MTSQSGGSPITPLIPLAATDQRLRQVCVEVSRRELRTGAVQAEIEQMLAFVYGHNHKAASHQRRRPVTVGLSANQVGIMRRISIVDLAIGRRDASDIHALINPRILARSQAVTRHSEGCVNLPQIWGPVERCRRVTVQALDRSGNTLTIEADGWAAVLLQHEIDHLSGQLFIDHLADPAKAHLVAPGDMKAYNKTSATDWPHYIDVRHLVRPDRRSSEGKLDPRPGAATSFDRG